MYVVYIVFAFFSNLNQKRVFCSSSCVFHVPFCCNDRIKTYIVKGFLQIIPTPFNDNESVQGNIYASKRHTDIAIDVITKLYTLT